MTKQSQRRNEGLLSPEFREITSRLREREPELVEILERVPKQDDQGVNQTDQGRERGEDHGT